MRPSMFKLRLRPTLLALLALSAAAAADDDDDKSPITTAPVFLPSYDKDSWSLMRGSVLTSNAKARQTAYTIFCLDNDVTGCDLSLEVPFIFVEGPDTMIFHGTYTSTYINNLECTLDGTTAATCSGYSSYKDGYCNGPVTGPTEISWTSTYTGTQVEWGVLTMAEAPEQTGNEYEIVVSGEATPTGSGYVNIPMATTGSDSESDNQSASAKIQGSLQTALIGALGTTVLAGVIF